MYVAVFQGSVGALGVLHSCRREVGGRLSCAGSGVGMRSTAAGSIGILFARKGLLCLSLSSSSFSSGRLDVTCARI